MGGANHLPSWPRDTTNSGGSRYADDCEENDCGRRSLRRPGIASCRHDRSNAREPRRHAHGLDESSPEEAELAALTDVIEAYEIQRWPDGKIHGGKG